MHTIIIAPTVEIAHQWIDANVRVNPRHIVRCDEKYIETRSITSLDSWSIITKEMDLCGRAADRLVFIGICGFDAVARECLALSSHKEIIYLY